MNDALRRLLAERHGLDPDSATEQDIQAAVETSPPPEDTNGSGDPGRVTEPVEEPEGVAARTATISRERLTQLERDAADGAAARASQIDAERTATVSAAIADGRITPAEAGLERGTDGEWPEGWRRDMDDAPEVTARALGRLEKGKYPGSARAQGVVPQTGNGDGPASLARARHASGVGRSREDDRKVIHR